MKLIQSNSELKLWQERVNAANGIGFVPTMGALHQGHLKLIERALLENSVVVCSIFVNPTQFNNREDLDAYPRTLDKDIRLLSKFDRLIVFAPSEQDVYPKGEIPKVPSVDLGTVGRIMEARERPGHFEGVLTVVNRLFELVQPTAAYFGLKDYQQYLVVKALAASYFPELKIIPCDIVRSAEGLALSSRNKRLSEEGLKKAASINGLLKRLKGTPSSDLSKEIVLVEEVFKKDPDFELEYLEVFNEINLEPATTNEQSSRVFVAVWLENVRLIDNMKL